MVGDPGDPLGLRDDRGSQRGRPGRSCMLFSLLYFFDRDDLRPTVVVVAGGALLL
jgi:hypothetical protein